MHATDRINTKILVLGAGGFIGRRIVAALTESGVPVLAAVRKPGLSFGDDVETVMVDATSEASLALALPGVGGIVNSVAGSSETIADNARALFPLAARAGLRVVHLSTMSVYGSMTGEVDEASSLTGELDDYGRAKLAVEELARASGGRVTLLRPGIVHGPESPLWSGLIGDLLIARRLGDLGPAGAGGCNLVCVDDVAAAVVAALARPETAGRTYNLGSPSPVPSWNDYFREYAKALNAQPLASISSSRLALELKLLGPLRKLAEIAVGPGKLGAPIRPWLTQLCAQPIKLSVVRAERELDMRWTPLAESLAQTAAWHASQSR